jgi:hypothetical protein
MHVLLLSLAILISCSKSKEATIQSGRSLSSTEVKAQQLLSSHMELVQKGQYEIPDSDLEALLKDGLITNEEFKSLKIVQ